MSQLDKINDFESQSISSLIFNLIKWYGFDDIEYTTCYRRDVESGVWISIKIAKGDETYYVEGQRLDIIKQRFLKLLERKFNLPHKLTN